MTNRALTLCSFFLFFFTNLVFAQSWIVTSVLFSSRMGATPPQIVLDSKGNAVAIWCNKSSNQMQGSFLPFDSTQWKSTSDLSTTAPGCTQFSLTTHKDQPIALWYNASNSSIEGASLNTDTLTWTSIPPYVISNDNLPIVPQMIVDSFGTITAVWCNPSSNSIQGAFLPPGYDQWYVTDDLISSQEGLSDVQLAVDSYGDAIAIWCNASKGTIQASYRYTSYTYWILTDDVASGVGLAMPKIAVNPRSGTAVAVWCNSYDGSIQSAMLPSVSSTSWTPCSDLAKAGGNRNPQLCMDNNGNAVAVWYSSKNSHISAAMLISEETTWKSSGDLSLNNGNRCPMLAISPLDGKAVAVWHNTTTSTLEAGYTFTSMGSWAILDDYYFKPKLTLCYPQVAACNQGRVVAVWYNAMSNCIQGAVMKPLTKTE